MYSPLLFISLTAIHAASALETFSSFFPDGLPWLVTDDLEAQEEEEPRVDDGAVVYGLQHNSCGIDDSGFDICLDLGSSDGTFQPWMDLFGAARTKWETVIESDFEPFDTTSMASFFGGMPTVDDAKCTYPAVIDDVFMCAESKEIDGRGGTLGWATLIFTRTKGKTNPRTGNPFNLPLAGYMAFDAKDIGEIDESILYDIMLHEMGHLLGLGLLWNKNGVYTPDSGLYRANTRAQAEFSALGCSGRLPVELDGGSGTVNSHWDEDCLKHELMSGFTDSKENAILSRITLGGLEDIGYTVNYSGADTFTRNDLGKCGASCPEHKNRRLSGKKRREHQRKRVLSQQGLVAAQRFAKKKLGALQQLPSSEKLPDGVAPVVGEHIDVIYLEDGHVHFVPINWEEVRDLEF